MPSKMVGTKSAALFASRMSNERSADELRPRKMERVNGVAPAFAQSYGGQAGQKCRFANACPEPLFKYFSKCWACSIDSNATYNLSFQGMNFDVCEHFPAL